MDKLNLFISILILSAKLASGQSIEKFDGLNIGIEVGTQNSFSGALIDDVDVITHQNEFASDITLGFRKSLINQHILIGIEIRYGLIDAQMNRHYNNGFQNIDIQYEASNQSGYGIELGTIIGSKRDLLLGSYLFVLNRNFDIIWTESNGTIHDQIDENRFIRYGLFVERAFKKGLSAYANIGNIYVDFGDANTTEKVSDKVEFAFGFKYQIPLNFKK